MGHEILSDTDIVVRGGQCLTINFIEGSGVHKDPLTGKLTDISTQAKPGATLTELSQPFKSGQVGVATVGEKEKVGGKITLEFIIHNWFC